jgi:23S rRNA pseudouridine2605 synthase
MAADRLQKILARAGVASRRAAEDLIRAGRVSVDGRKVTELGVTADPRTARIEVDGKRIVGEQLVYLIFHKPRLVVCTMSDPEGRPTVAEYVAAIPERVVPVGRLDFHTSGVLLLTNDGEFAARLTHPSKKVPKTYVVKVHGELSDNDLERWRQPVQVGESTTRPADVERLRWEAGKTWLQVTLHEGKNRQIHRISEQAGHQIMRLARVEFAGLNAEGLRPGKYRALSVEELTVLKKDYGVPLRVRAAAPAPAPAGPTERARRVVGVRGAAPTRGRRSVRQPRPR